MKYAILMLAGVLLAQNSDPPAAAARGKKLFFEEGPKCATCHLAEGKGRKVGPDLKRLAMLHPRALKMAILSNGTEYVVVAKLKTGESFPAMRVEQNADTLKLWDLSKPEPEMKTLKPADLDSYGANSTWKHPPTSAGLSMQQLADIMSYIRFAAEGDRKGVSAEDIE